MAGHFLQEIWIFKVYTLWPFHAKMLAGVSFLDPFCFYWYRHAETLQLIRRENVNLWTFQQLKYFCCLFSSLNWIFNNDQIQVQDALDDIQLQFRGQTTSAEENLDLQISPLKEEVLNQGCQVRKKLKGQMATMFWTISIIIEVDMSNLF